MKGEIPVKDAGKSLGLGLPQIKMHRGLDYELLTMNDGIRIKKTYIQKYYQT